MPTSEYLDRILANQNRTVGAKIVFTDIVSYSKRRSQTQAEVVDVYMQCLRGALDEVAGENVRYLQANKFSFDCDLIRVSAGDGAAVIFPFEGIHDVHLKFSLALLRRAYEARQGQKCEKFSEHGWCNCHPFFNLTVGVSEGKVVLYRDLNGNYNGAGNSLNLAARTMGVASANQILFEEQAYRQIIDLVDVATLDQKFLAFEDVRVKHGIRLNLYQYIDDSLPYLNSGPNKELTTTLRMSAVSKSLQGLGLPIHDPNMDGPDIDSDKLVEMMEAFSKLIKGTGGVGNLISGAIAPNAVDA